MESSKHRSSYLSSFGQSLAVAFVLLAMYAVASVAEDRPGTPVAPRRDFSTTLTAFHSDAELRQFLKRRVAHRAMAMDAAPMAGNMAQVETVAQPAAKAASPSVTNNQEAGVDEGDIVKMHGDIMVILRRGRLFTVSLARGGMRPVDAIDAYPPGVDARDDWYDEMLVAGDRVIVIGYSYARGGTEINRFRIGDGGRLRFEDSYQLRSNDYYSARNYASRLIGNQLIVYSPLYLPYGNNDPLEALPALRRWTGDPSRSGFRRIASAQQVYIPAVLRDSPDLPIEALHTVTSCNLAAAVLDCSAISVLGPASRSYYVSGHAVYVWVTAWQGRGDRDGPPASLVYRLPLDGARPSAVGARGAPADQFSFREDPSDGALDVLVRSEGTGDAMWNPEFTDGAVALLHIPRQSFEDGASEVDGWHYRELPKPTHGGYSFNNRFVGDYVLYGLGNDWGAPEDHEAELVAVPVRGGDVTALRLPHGVDRIEAMGSDAVVVGSDSSELTFTSIELASRSEPRIGDHYALEASQAETRSHGFFFLPDTESTRFDDGSSGVLGLPVARPARAAYRQLFENSAAMIFLRREHRQFAPLGELAARTDGIVDDDCHASCVDWYGNARPIFAQGRTFALLGYELVEGALGRSRIHEIGRISFAPGADRAMPPPRS